MRLLFVLFALVVGSGFVIYIICAIVMPDERKLYDSYGNPNGGDYTQYTYTDANGSTTYTSADDSTEGSYQDRAANSEYGSYNQNPGQSYSQYNGQPQPASRRKNLGIVMVIVAGLILLKYFVPRIPDALVFAGALLVIGLLLIFRKK